jgi:hypothetical protein
MKITVFWDVAPSSVVDTDWEFTAPLSGDNPDDISQYLPDYVVQNPRRWPSSVE